MIDHATCPECQAPFDVVEYGRKIPCPKCGVLLDIQPDPSGKAPSRKLPISSIPLQDWVQTFKNEIEWIKGELLDMQGGEQTAFRRSVQKQLNRLEKTLRQLIGDTGNGKEDANK